MDCPRNLKHPTALARQPPATDDPARAPQIAITVFQCPDDRDSFRQPGGLSYVANAGYGDFRADPATGIIREIGRQSLLVDRDGDGQVTERDVRLNLATGVFWREASLDGVSFGWTLDAIEQADGLGQTLLLAENANAGSWYSRNTTDLGFVIGREVLRFETGPTSRGPLHLSEPVELGPYALERTGRSHPGRSCSEFTA